MSENAVLRQCPRCTLSDCKHDELVISNALRNVRTGMGNIDIIATSYTWLGTARKLGRIAFVELKRTGETMAKGQELSLFHVTGTLKTAAGYVFEQRAFGLWQEKVGRWRVKTWHEKWDAPEVLALEATEQQAALIIGKWLETGELH